MPVTISVSEVRQALYLAAGAQDAAGPGAPSIAVLGQWFHDGLGWLVDARRPGSPISLLADVHEDLDLWKRTLVERCYSQFVGPRLTSHHAALHDVAAQVSSFWQAMQAACHWIAELAWSLRPLRRLRKQDSGQVLGEWLTTEEPLSCELRDSSWTDSVRLVGIADAVIRLHQEPGHPDQARWCAIEFKLGQTSPAADLGQACLYHLMLTSGDADELSSRGADSNEHVDYGTLALVSFHPERQERLFTAAELDVARSRLLDLIGKLAGVDCRLASAPAGRTGPTTGAVDAAPPQSLVSSSGLNVAIPTDEHRRLGEKLVDTLTNEHGVAVSLEGPPIVGPTFLRFTLKLGRRTKVASVQSRIEELQLRLGLLRPPFIKIEDGALVADIQRPDRQRVWFDEIRRQLPPSDPRLGASQVPIGVDIHGRLVCADLATTQHSHILAAGTTGSGKSEWLRTAIAGLIATNTPDTLRLLIIDPKRNAFHDLRRSPFLWKPLVFPDEQPAADALKDLAAEMDVRYKQLDGADSIAQLVARTNAALPRIVCICDEYRDLISRSREERKQIEEQICRLGAKARAAGIHLILATQEPRRETIKGPLDSNIPARVGLWMQKAQESRMLLSESGAESLLGNGDLLFKDAGPPRRLQAPLLSEQNRQEIFGA